MEKMVTIDVFSDNMKMNEILDVLHDIGLKTAGMTREIIGNRSEEIEWERCKNGECSALVVDLFGDSMKTTAEHMHDIDDVEEKPLFLYRLNVIDDVPDTVEDTTEEEENKGEEKMENVTLNIGMVTRNYMPINVKVAKKIIGLTTDCTISECTGYYKGHEEPSLKVEIYGVSCEKGVDLAHEFARDFNQECVACTVRFKTVFVDAMATMEERKAMTEELKNQ